MTATARQGRYAVVFPGAGSQVPGMAAGLLARSPVASEVLATVERVSGLPIRHLCTGAGVRELTRVSAGYPAIFATSVTAYTVIRQMPALRGRPPELVAGHSLGHFAALVAAGALDLDSATAFVVTRARLMQDASDQRPGAMLSVVGLAYDTVSDLCRTCPATHGIVVVACRNGPRHLVVAGDVAAVEWAAARLAELPTERVVRVRAGLAAHSPLMEPVRRALAPAVRALSLRTATVPVLLNTTGALTTRPDALRRDLAAQISQPVRWDSWLGHARRRGVNLLLDAGPGDVLARLSRATGDIPAVAVNGPIPVPDLPAGWAAGAPAGGHR